MKKQKKQKTQMVIIHHWRINMLNDFIIEQIWNKWQTYVLYQDFVKTFRIGSSSREIINICKLNKFWYV